MKCTFCNSEIPDNSAYCPRCGQRLSDHSTDQTLKASSQYWNKFTSQNKADYDSYINNYNDLHKNKNKRGIILLIILIVVFAGVAVWILTAFVFSNKQQTHSGNNNSQSTTSANSNQDNDFVIDIEDMIDFDALDSITRP